MTQIPPIDLTQQYTQIQAETLAAVSEVLASGRYIGGAVVEGFEREFAAYIGTSQCVACNSGTDALYLALRALDIGPGDEVITSPFTFFATAEVISAVGATPVFVDIDAITFNLDPAHLEAAITPKTRGIIPVHLFGHPTSMTPVMAIAQAHRLAVIEDCAQATGAMWAEQRVGQIGTIGCFSFFPTKNLGGCGDGGAITTQDPELAERIRILKEHGSPKRYYHEAIGINSRLDALQAAILRIKLKYLDEWNQRRAEVAQRYQEQLASLAGVICPQVPVGGQSVWNQYTIRLTQADRAPAPPSGAFRDSIKDALQTQGISTMVYYPIPLHLQPVYRFLGYAAGCFPVAEQAAHEVLSLPMFPELTADQQDRVVHALKDSLKR